MAQKIALPPPVAQIYRAVKELERQYPGRKFTPDGHLVGSIGEVIAAQHFGLTLHPASHPAHDAFDLDGQVQIKMTAGNKVSMYGECERLIVLKVISAEHAEVIYDGPGKPAWASAGRQQKNGQRTIGLTKLKSLAVESQSVRK